MTITQPESATTTDPMGLAGRVAVVTGAAKGIGLVIAATLAGYGVRVALTDRDAEALQETVENLRLTGGEVTGYTHDVTDAAGTAHVFEDILQNYGSLDILVNNAGVSRGTPFLDVDEAEWDRVNDINCRAVFFMCKAVVPHMMARRYGKIVNISSIAGKEATPLFTHYSAAKFGVMAITQGLAKELGKYSINVNAVCPGIVRTPLWDPLLRQLSETKAISEAAAFDEFVAQIPLRRPQEPRDIAEAVAFLASDRARNITGQGLNVCGGMQLH